MSYTIGGAQQIADREQTIVGTKRDDGVYLSLTARIKVLLAFPDGSEAGGEVLRDEIDERLRRACADALLGIVIEPFIVDRDDVVRLVVETACVQEFEPDD